MVRRVCAVLLSHQSAFGVRGLGFGVRVWVAGVWVQLVRSCCLVYLQVGFGV